MKLRVMGTKDECMQAQEFYRYLGRQNNVKYCAVSELYPNRGSVGLYRVYIDIECREEINIYDCHMDVDEPNTEDPLLYPTCLDDVYEGGV